jgi:hypothetical protein
MMQQAWWWANNAKFEVEKFFKMRKSHHSHFPAQLP